MKKKKRNFSSNILINTPFTHGKGYNTRSKAKQLKNSINKRIDFDIFITDKDESEYESSHNNNNFNDSDDGYFPSNDEIDTKNDCIDTNQRN